MTSPVTVAFIPFEAMPWLILVALAGVAYLGYRVARLRSRQRGLEARARRLEGELLHVRRRLYAYDARQALTRAGRTERLPVEFTAQYAEDIYLWELFEGKLDGVYIEVGAFDGYAFSVTYPFEAVGWTGVLIEAIPERYRACVARRPHSHVAHAALAAHPRPGEGSGRNRTATFTIVEGDAPDQMLSYLTPSEAHKDLLQKAEKSGGMQRTITVPLSTMDDVLADAATAGGPAGIAGRRIDFAVIDVEGAETAVLEGFDLEKHKPRVLVVEDMVPRDAASPSAYLARRHYTLVARVGVSGVFIRNDEKQLIERARVIAASRR